MSDNKKVVRFKKRKGINIGIVIFFIIFIYIAINVTIYFTKDSLSIYEVPEGAKAEENIMTALIIRDEKLINSEKAGYISYLQKDGARIAKGSSVYSVNDSTRLTELVTNGDTPIKLTKDNYAQINHDIQDFKNTYRDDNFSSVYQFKENIKGTVQDLLNSAIIDQANISQEDSSTSYNIVQSNESGIVSFYTDSLNGITKDMVTSEMFQTDQYKKTSLRTSDMVTQNSPIYKLVSSDQWSLIIMLTKEQYDRLSDQKKLTFLMKGDNIEITAQLSLFQKGSDYFGQLSMDKLMSNYINERFLQIEIDFNTEKGLKIPLSSIVEKEFYLVPLNFFTKGANSDKDGLNIEVYNKAGEVSYQFVPTDIYYKDDTYGYVDTNMFELNTWVHSTENSDRIQLSQRDKLTGVYNVNKGYAVFRMIEILQKDKEYCIIKNGTPYGLAAFDHIALDGEKAVDQKIIY